MEGGCCGSAAAHATPSSCLPLLAAPSHGSGSWLVFKVERKGGLCRLVVEWKVVALWLAVLLLLLLLQLPHRVPSAGCGHAL